MARFYQLIKSRLASQAFNGLAAKTHGDRWNCKGILLAYGADDARFWRPYLTPPAYDIGV